jgi:signal transduction histidine kinase
VIKNLIKSFFTRKNKETKKTSSLTRDYCIYAGLILAIILTSSLWSAMMLYKSQKSALQDQLITQSQLIDAKLSDYLNYVSHIAEDKGHKIALKGGNDLQNISLLFKRNFFFPVTKSGLKKKAFFWPNFSWVDKKGNILVKSEIGILPKPQKAKNAKHLYQSTINSWQLNLSEPYFDSSEDKTFIDASLGVCDLNNEEYIGSITTKFNIEKLVEAIEADLKESTKFIILDEGLRIIIKSDDIAINNDDFFIEKLTNESADSELIIMNNQLKYHNNVYRIYKKSSDYPFIILTGYNANLFNKEFIINFIERFIAIFGAVFFVAIILFFQRRRILNEEKRTNLKLTDLNNQLSHQNELAKKSKKSREKFLSQSKKEIIEDTIMKIVEDINNILDHGGSNIAIAKKTIDDTHKKILSRCVKIISYVSDNLNLSCVSVKKIIEESIEMTHHDANMNGVELIFEIPNKVADIEADERSIKHVITSLINHAMEDRKRGKETSFVKITAKNKKQKDQKFVQITFEDNGHGISEEMRMSFEQTAEKEGTAQNNTSLSLYAIRSVLSSHDATIQIDNMIGKGSIIQIQIPQKSTDKKTKDELPENDNIINLFPKI